MLFIVSLKLEKSNIFRGCYMEDMHFDSGLAFRLNEEEEAVNSKKSDSLILSSDPRSFSFGNLTSTLPVTDIRWGMVRLLLEVITQTELILSCRKKPLPPLTFPGPFSTSFLPCRASCIPLCHASYILPLWSCHDIL